MKSETWPFVIGGLGGALAVVWITEALLFVVAPATTPAAHLSGLITGAPFIGLLMYGGYYLKTSGISTARYSRMGRWVIVGIGLSILGNMVLMASIPLEGILHVSGWIRWGVSIGAGIGLVIGVFEARAIDRELAAERARMRNEQLRAKNAQLEEFASIVSHDLRNPLSVAKGYLELARKDCKTPHHDPVERAHGRMTELIDDLLALAKAGTMTEEPEPVPLAEVTAECWEVVDTKDATLDTESSAVIRANRARVRQLLENLFRNAVEHGGTDVTVRVGTLATGDGFYVSDTGPGIPAERREEVFVSGVSTNPDGTGFGLAIVKQIADTHGWSVAITEQPGGGARFEITGVEFVSPSSERLQQRGAQTEPSSA